MKRIYLPVLFLACCLVVSATTSVAQNLDEKGALPRATPESVGVPSDALVEFIQRLDKNVDRVDSVMVLRDGKVIAEAWRAPNDPKTPHAMYSLSKSFTSTAVGFAVAEGKMSIDWKLVDIFPDDLPAEPSENLKKITIESLLSMSCGHDSEVKLPNSFSATYDLPTPVTIDGPTWVQAFLAHPVPHEPGTTFRYNTPGTYMVAAAFQKLVGESVRDYLVPRLFEPLRIAAPVWEKSPEGVTKGGTGLFLTTEDVAKFGQFLLQRGKWNGEQLLPEEWVDLASQKHVSNGNDPNSDWAQGYAFQFWRCRYNSYRGDGKYGQFVVVMPDQNAVVVLTSDCKNTAEELNAIFDDLRPKMQDAPLTEDPDAVAKLREAEKSLAFKEGFSGSQLYRRTIKDGRGQEMRYVVYVPNGYLTSSERYPVLYLLHGYSDDEKTWSSDAKGQMKRICDEYFAKHPEQKRIIVMPDGRVTWYRDSQDGSDPYETFFFESFIPQIEKEFRCKTAREDRAIAGLSMGGYGTLLYALHHPDMFNAAYAMSPAVMPPKRRPDGNNEYSLRNDPIELVKNMDDQKKGDIRYTIDIGDDDFLIVGAFQFFQEARAKGVPCEMRVRNGGHSWDYWRVSLPLALDFITNK